MDSIHSQVQLMRTTATAMACSLFRCGRARMDRQRAREGSIPGTAHPGSRFAHIVEARSSCHSIPGSSYCAILYVAL